MIIDCSHGLINDFSTDIRNFYGLGEFYNALDMLAKPLIHFVGATLLDWDFPLTRKVCRDWSSHLRVPMLGCD